MIINEPGNYTLLYTAEDSCGNKTEETRELTVSRAAQVFGAIWDGSDSTRWTRTDLSESFSDPEPAVNNGTGSSPFDNYMPWSGMEIVEDETAGTLVSIPKYWYKWTREGTSMHLQIANEAKSGFLVSPAHADRGDGVGERDVVYVGRYHSIYNFKSTTGYWPSSSKKRDVFRNGMHSLGSDIWQYDFAMYWTIAMLYLVEFADWNSQAVIGYGCGNGSSTGANGSTDAMQYHTGTDAASRTTYGHVQYRYIEGLWSRLRDWVDGIYFNGTDIYVINNPAQFSDTENGVLIGTRASTNGIAKTFTEPSTSGYEYALYPTTSQNGSYTIRTCDDCDYNNAGNTLSVGGSYDQSQASGMFFMSGYWPSSNDSGYIGSRLQKLP